MTIKKLTDAAEVQAALDAARQRSEHTLEQLRSMAQDVFDDHPALIVGINGSIARREATVGSDVDLFVLTTSDDMGEARDAHCRYRAKLLENGIKMPANGGVFEAPLKDTLLASTIGGEDDTNTYITRRMLYLLEGEWIANENEFSRLRNDLVARYVPDDLEEHKLTRFFLNDVIRYWRTICVDFEHKTADATKPRAIRLVKLRLSRMLLYVGGIAAARETINMTAKEKRETLTKLLGQPPIDRLTKIFGEQPMAPVLAHYATFLSALDIPEVREQLERPGAAGMSTDEYRALADVSRDFRTAILAILAPEGTDDQLVQALLL